MEEYSNNAPRLQFRRPVTKHQQPCSKAWCSAQLVQGHVQRGPLRQCACLLFLSRVSKICWRVPAYQTYQAVLTDLGGVQCGLS